MKLNIKRLKDMQQNKESLKYYLTVLDKIRLTLHEENQIQIMLNLHQFNFQKSDTIWREFILLIK